MSTGTSGPSCLRLRTSVQAIAASIAPYRHGPSRAPPTQSSVNGNRAPSAVGSVDETRLWIRSIALPPGGGGSSDHQSCRTFDTSHGSEPTTRPMSGSQASRSNSRRRQTSQASAGRAITTTCGVAHQPSPSTRPSRSEVAARPPLVEAEREQHDGQAEHDRRTVEAVCASRLPDDVRGPDPEDARPEPCVRLADGPDPDPPRQQRADREEQDRRCAERLDGGAGDGERERCQEHFLRAAVALTPVERTRTRRPGRGAPSVRHASSASSSDRRPR